MFNDMDVDNVSVKSYTDKLKWFSENYDSYEEFINTIHNAFKEYYYESGFNYTDFHGENLIKDLYGEYKLIDL